MRRLVAAAALALLPLALAACGGGSKHSSGSVQLTPVAYVKQAAQKTAAAPSEHMTMNGSTSIGGQSLTISGAGDFDNGKKSGTMHMDFSAGGLNGSIDEVMIGTVVYAKSPLFASTLPGGKTWLKVDAAKAAKAHGLDISALMAQAPATSVSQLLATTDATKVGTETVDGASATHYHGTVDFSKLPQGAKIPGLSTAQAPFDVWIDDATGYVRRVKLAYSLGTASVSFTMDFSKFGETVNVQAPAAADTFDATSASLKGLVP